MAPKVYDRVKEYTVSTGVGGITFVGAFNGFQKFSDVLTSGDTTYYVIEENDKWEVGIGTYGSNNLDRTTVLTSSNNGNKVSLGGSGVVSITYPAGRAAFSDEVDYVSGVAVYASGLVGGGGATVDQLNYVSGIAVYSSGQAITNKTDISTNSSDISYVSGVADYASGQAVSNEGQISSVSGWADSTFLKSDDDSYVSGVAVYASGQTIANKSDIAANTSNISTNTSRVNYASGQAISNQSNISTNTGNISTNTAKVNYASGQAVENESQISSVSGWAGTYADIGDASVSGWADSTFIKLDDDSYVSGIADYASGQAIVNESDIATNASNISTNTSRVAYASGQAIQNEIDILYVSGVAAAGGGGDVTTQQLEYVSGIALYSSGQAIENESQISSVSGWAGVYADAGDVSVSGWADSTFIKTDDDSYVSGIAAYSSGQVVSNQASISTNASNISSNTAKVDYASGLAITNEADISYVSGIAVYGSGHTLQTVTDNGASTTNAITITNNNITASSGLFDSLDMTPLGNGSQPAYQEGVVFYDSENHTLSLYNDEADVTLQLGQEEFLRVRNNTGATIPNGAAVLINGAHGNAAPTISGAIATFEAGSQVVGLATHNIETGSFGYVTTYGIVRDVDTSAFSAGDEIFLSATQIGSGVAVAPATPNYKVTVGHVIRSHDSNGTILVQVGHPKLGGGDLQSEKPLNMSGVPFVTSISNTTAGGSQTDPLFIFDSGNRQLQLGSGVQLLDGAPSNTSNVLYNDGGTLSFDGSAVGGASLTAGSGITIDGVDQINVYGGSGHFQNIQLETTGTEDALLLTSTDAGSDAAPVISTMKDSASPADGDYLGQLKFKGRSDTGTERVYAKITGKTLDVTNGTEDGVIEFMVRANGSNKIISRLRNDGLRILNDASLLIQDGGNVGIRNTNPSYPLDVEGDAHVASGLLVGDTLDVSGVATFDQVTTFQSGVKTNINTEADAATITFDMDQSNTHMVILGDNRTLAVSNVDVGQKFMIRLEQDSTGSRTVTWWSNIKWAEGGTEPTLTTTGGKADLFGFLSPSGGYYDGFVVGQNI